MLLHRYTNETAAKLIIDQLNHSVMYVCTSDLILYSSRMIQDWHGWRLSTGINGNNNLINTEQHLVGNRWLPMTFHFTFFSTTLWIIKTLASIKQFPLIHNKSRNNSTSRHCCKLTFCPITKNEI